MIYLFSFVTLLSGYGIGYFIMKKKHDEYVEFLNDFYKSKIKDYQERID